MRGLRNVSKRGAIFSYLKMQKATIYCLQETYSSPEDEKVWSAEWGGKIIYSHGTTHSKGVCTLLNPNSPFKLSSIQVDPEGRFLIAKLTIEEKYFCIVNTYGPNNCHDQDDFLKALSQQLVSKTDTSKVIISGDWNITLNRIDKLGGLPWKATSSRNTLVDLMKELNLTDIYRELHPKSKSFTYVSKSLNLKSRIDYFLISRSLSCDVKQAEIRISIAPDHNAIFLSIDVKNDFNRGPGLWKFNNTLLEDNNYKELITFYYPQILRKYSEVTDNQLLWELIKMELRSKTIGYSKDKRCKLRNKEEVLQKELQELDSKICNGDYFDQDILEKFEAAKEELKQLHEVRGKEAMFRSKMKWVEQGEKPTKYFYNLEKTNYEKKLIREVKLENEEIISNPSQVNKEIEAFYRKMYTAKINDNMDNHAYEHKFKDFIEDLDIPQLSDEEQSFLEKDLTINELKEGLTSFADNKSPGEDGFTKEFYQTFFDLLCKDLLNSYNEAFCKGSLSVSQKRGTITLIPKGDENLTELKNWRPISLLNIDYKILSKVLARRMEKVLPKLVHSDQTGFVNGRYIGQNIRLLNDIMEYTDIKKLPGIFLFVDFEKAFDTIEWSFISNTLEVFKFGCNFQKWFSVIYNNIQSAVMNGGRLTDYFEITRGVRQGCPLSPSLFILTVELLALKIRQSPNCRGIRLPNAKEVRISQFADDTTIITNNTDSLRSHLQTMEEFGAISGLKLNRKKTKAMWLGSMKHNTSKILEFKSTREPVKVLGIFLGYNQDKIIEENFLSRIRKMKTRLNLWLSRDLTLYGKSLLAKTLGVSQLVYVASLLSVPNAVIKIIQTELFSFLWKNKKDKIKRAVIYQPLAEGGLNFINFATMVKSLRLAWLSRLLGDNDDSWKVIPNYYLSEYGGLQFLLKCNYNAESINKCLPNFYRELLQYFQEFKNKTNIFPYGEFLLWNNKAITIENSSVFWRSWFKRKIIYVQDVLNAEGNFLTLEEFQNKFKIKTNFLYYLQLIAAIPSDLKKKAATIEIPSQEVLNTAKLSSSAIATPDLSEMRCKNYYKILSGNGITEPTGIKNWKNNFPDYFTDWEKRFSFIYKSTKDNKLRQFSFRLLHRITTTKKELFKFRLVEDEACTLCLLPDSIEHTFLDCTVTTAFYSKAISWFNHENDTHITLSSKQVTFNDIPRLTHLTDYPRRRLHLFVIILKQYIYACKCLDKKPNMQEFQRKVILQWQIEKCALP